MSFENNKVDITGKAMTEPEYSHTVFKHKFYVINIAVKRFSAIDIVPVVVPEEKIDSSKKYTESFVSASGSIRSCYKKTGVKGKKNLKVFVFANEFRLLENVSGDIYQNMVEIKGKLAYKPIRRRTPDYKEIACMELLVMRSQSKKNYKIPCVCWGSDIARANELAAGDEVTIYGRFQSRKYVKNHQKKCAFEISVSYIGKVD